MSEQSKHHLDEARQALKAAERLQAAIAAQDSLLAYAQFTSPDAKDPEDATKSRYMATAHGRLLCQIVEKIERRELKRVCVSIGPQFGKSEVLSRKGPAWISGRDPHANMILASYNQPNADKFGGEVRELVESRAHQQVFPGYELRKGQQDYQVTHKGGQLAFVGVGGSGTGRPADFFFVDDPIKSSEEANSETFREKMWDWFNGVVFTRCHDDSAILVVHCLTGDTPVTMADGERKSIADVRPGDSVLAWSEKGPVQKKVLNWADQGVQPVLELKTGNSTVRGTARHPFLTIKDGVYKWRTLGELKKGDRIVVSGAEEYGAQDRLTPADAWLLGFMFGDGWLTRRDCLSSAGYKGRRYPRRAWVTCCAASKYPELNERVLASFERKFGCRPKATKYGYWRTERQAIGRWFAEHGLVGKAKTKTLPQWLFSQSRAVREAFVIGFSEADGCVNAKKQTTIGASNGRLVAGLRHLARSCGFRPSNLHYETFVAQPPNSKAPVQGETWRFSWGQHRDTEGFATAEVRSVTPKGNERVYDIQVEGAENFLADGLVSHNTRWHEDDLIGRLCDPDHPEREKKYSGIAKRWTYINLPAVVEDPGLAAALGLKLEEQTDEDVVKQFGKKPISSLWPGRKSLPLLAEAKGQDARTFNALYMGKPTPEDGEYFKESYIVPYHSPSELPKDLRKYGASDHAVSTKSSADSTVVGCVGVDTDGDIWVMDDLVMRRMETDVTVDELLLQFLTHKPQLWWMESELISKSFGPFLKKLMHEKRIYTTLDPVVVAKDKSTRARAIQGRMSHRRVHFPVYAPWWPEAKNQLLKFPYATHDDFVDWLSHIGMGLLKEIPASAPSITARVVEVGSPAWVLAQTRVRAQKARQQGANSGW